PDGLVSVSRPPDVVVEGVRPALPVAPSVVGGPGGGLRGGLEAAHGGGGGDRGGEGGGEESSASHGRAAFLGMRRCLPSTRFTNVDSLIRAHDQINVYHRLPSRRPDPAAPLRASRPSR